MAEPNTLSDNGYISGSYDVVIDGAAYTLDTVDHDLPVAESVAMTAAGLFNGGASVKQQQKLSVKINAVTGVKAPSQLVPFSLAIHGYAARNWKVTNLKIASSNSGAALRTYSADITEYKAALVAGS